MSRKITFTEASARVLERGFSLLKYAGSVNGYGSVLLCPCGEEWSTKLNNVLSKNKTGCPKCALEASRMDPQQIAVALKAEGHTLVEVCGPVRGQRTKVRALCPKGHERECRLSTLIYAKSPCGECSRVARKVDRKGVEDRLALRGYRLVDWGGTSRSSGTFECRCGASWKARVNSVLQGQSNCPSCFSGGFKCDEPATFYVYRLSKGRRVCYGYGISGDFARRNAEHFRSAEEAGWSIGLFKTYKVDRGELALEVEKAAKATIVTPRGMFKGFKTEAVRESDLNALLRLADCLVYSSGKDSRAGDKAMTQAGSLKISRLAPYRSQFRK